MPQPTSSWTGPGRVFLRPLMMRMRSGEGLDGRESFLRDSDFTTRRAWKNIAHFEIIVPDLRAPYESGPDCSKSDVQPIVLL